MVEQLLALLHNEDFSWPIRKVIFSVPLPPKIAYSHLSCLPATSATK